MWDRIDKKKRIQEWIEWSDIEIEIRQPNWGQHIPRAWFDPKQERIVINSKQSDKEIIKSIIHEVSHWKHNDRPEDPDKWQREERCIQKESEWKKHPEEIKW